LLFSFGSLHIIFLSSTFKDFSITLLFNSFAAFMAAKPLCVGRGFSREPHWGVRGVVANGIGRFVVVEIGGGRDFHIELAI